MIKLNEMKYTTGRHGDTAIETSKVIIYIGEDRYRMTQSVDGKLNVNKISDGDSDKIRVWPCYANEIEIN